MAAQVSLKGGCTVGPLFPVYGLHTHTLTDLRHSATLCRTRFSQHCSTVVLPAKERAAAVSMVTVS